MAGDTSADETERVYETLPSRRRYRSETYTGLDEQLQGAIKAAKAAQKDNLAELLENELASLYYSEGVNVE